MFIFYGIYHYSIFKSLPTELFYPADVFNGYNGIKCPQNITNRFWFICRGNCLLAAYLYYFQVFGMHPSCAAVFKLNFVPVVKLLNQFNPYSFMQHKKLCASCLGCAAYRYRRRKYYCPITVLQVLLLLMRISESCYRNQQCYYSGKECQFAEIASL